VAVARAVEFVGLPEARINLAQGVTYLALAPKSNASYAGINAALADVERGGNRTPPAHLRDGSYRGAATLGRGVGYRYPHAEGGFVAAQSHLPEGLEDRRYYEPGPHGLEARLGELLAELRRRRGAAGDVLEEGGAR
jgi:putative ATPase